MKRFADRRQAGRLLAGRVAALGLVDPVVVGLPRGGVAVAAEVAAALQAPLEVVVVRKLGLPSQPEVGMGAIGEDGVRVVNEDLVARLAIAPETIDRVAEAEGAEVRRRVAHYRGDRPGISVRGRTVVVVDDGVATGGTVRAAVEVLRARGAARVVLAVPVAPLALMPMLRGLADDVVCLLAVDDLVAVGAWYEDFHQLGDDEVARLVGEPVAQDVQVPVGPVLLEATVTVPADPVGLVVFVHGSGSGRASPRNRAVAAALNRAGLATLLPDLLSGPEAAQQASLVEVDPLARRLLSVVRWARRQPALAGLPLGLYGSSTGAAAALIAAATLGDAVGAVVSRGGHPELAAGSLPDVVAPTLLVVGDCDPEVLELNRAAATALCCEHHLEVVPGATHLFSEPGTLNRVASLAAAWFLDHLPTAAGAGRRRNGRNGRNGAAARGTAGARAET